MVWLKIPVLVATNTEMVPLPVTQIESQQKHLESPHGLELQMPIRSKYQATTSTTVQTFYWLSELKM